jgi:hypothetical protein
MTKQLREEFDKFMEENCCVSEMCYVMAVCHKSDERMRDMMDYITTNQLQCKDMIQDGECVLDIYEKYEKILRRSLLYEGIVVDYSKYMKKEKPEQDDQAGSEND